MQEEGEEFEGLSPESESGAFLEVVAYSVAVLPKKGFHSCVYIDVPYAHEQSAEFKKLSEDLYADIAEALCV